VNTITLEHFGITETGRTVTEAKKAAGVKLERFVKHHRPKTVHVHGWIAMVWPDPQGGSCYEIISDPDGYRATPGLSFSNQTVEEQIASVVVHLAQNSNADLLAADPCWQQIGNYDERRKAYNEYRYWQGFQSAYKATPDDLPETARHGWACEHAREFTTAEAC